MFNIQYLIREKTNNNNQKQIIEVHWLVVLTILKNIGQWEGLSHILCKITKMFETTNQYSNFGGMFQQTM